jgi:cell division protein FtsW (lipid II flippase)
LKKGRIGFVIKNVLLYGIFGVFGLLILSKVFPANAKYLMNRFTELSETSVTSGPNNMQYRFIMTKIIVSDINENMKLFGMGPVTENQDPLVDPMRKSTADLVWTGVIYRWGFVGLVLFICLYIFSLMKGYSYYLESQNELSDLALFFILFIVSQMIESFVSWTFMSGHGLAIGLWYFAMLSALLGFKQDEEVSDVKINYISD